MGSIRRNSVVDGLDVVAVGVEHVGAVVALVVLGSQPRRAVIAPSCLQLRGGRLVEPEGGVLIVAAEREASEGLLPWLVGAALERLVAPVHPTRDRRGRDPVAASGRPGLNPPAEQSAVEGAGGRRIDDTYLKKRQLTGHGLSFRRCFRLSACPKR